MEQKPPAKLPPFHPATRIRSLGNGEPDFTIADATCHVAVFGVTGSGKTSATARWGGLGYMTAEMGMIFFAQKLRTRTNMPIGPRKPGAGTA